VPDPVADLPAYSDIAIRSQVSQSRMIHIDDIIPLIGLILLGMLVLHGLNKHFT
jgi:hypothetical protein